MKLAITAAAALLCALSATSAANAAPVYFCSNGGINLVTQGCVSGGNGFPRGGDGIYSNAGGGDTETAVEAAILAATGVSVNISLYGKSDNNASLFTFNGNNNPAGDLSGTWDVVNNGLLINYITVKAAQGYALYQLAGTGANSGSFTTEGLLTPNGRNRAEASHISFWTARVSAVPEPATWAMMIGGFAMIGASIRRRRPGVATA